MKSFRIPLRIIFYKDGEDWVAHCLEFDLMGDGPSKEDAVSELWEAIKLQVEATLDHGNPGNLFTPADGKFLEMFAAGTDVGIGELKVEAGPMDHVYIDRVEAREYTDAETAMA